MPWPGRIVNQPPPGFDLGKITRIGLRVHRHHDIDAVGPGLVARPGDTDFVPGRQPLDIGREVVLADDRDAHAEDRLHQQAVGTGRTRAVDCCYLDDDVVYSSHC